MPVAFHPLRPGFRRAVAASGAQVLADRHPPVRTRSDAGVIGVAPVREVVAAFGAGLRVVGDFVGQQPEARGFLGRGFIEPGGIVVFGQHDLTPAVQGLERRAGFDRELVEGQVIGGQRQSGAQFAAPGGFVLPRPCVDQVEGQAREDGACGLQRLNRLGRGVLAAEHP